MHSKGDTEPESSSANSPQPHLHGGRGATLQDCKSQAISELEQGKRGGVGCWMQGGLPWVPCMSKGLLLMELGIRLQGVTLGQLFPCVGGGADV